MVARLWAEQIINGSRTFDQVPAKLKQQVSNILTEKGYAEKITG